MGISSVIRALNSSCSNLVFYSTVASTILFYDHPFCASLFVFAVCNALVGKLLKIILAEKRPPGASKQRKSLGMPSSHANALAFHSMYLTQGVYYHKMSSDGDDVVATLAVLIVGVVCYCYTLCVCYARVYYTHDHTRAQILAGLALGSLSGWVASRGLFDGFAALYRQHCADTGLCDHRQG